MSLNPIDHLGLWLGFVHKDKMDDLVKKKVEEDYVPKVTHTEITKELSDKNDTLKAKELLHEKELKRRDSAHNVDRIHWKMLEESADIHLEKMKKQELDKTDDLKRRFKKHNEDIGDVFQAVLDHQKFIHEDQYQTTIRNMNEKHDIEKDKQLIEIEQHKAEKKILEEKIANMEEKANHHAFPSYKPITKQMVEEHVHALEGYFTEQNTRPTRLQTEFLKTLDYNSKIALRHLQIKEQIDNEVDLIKKWIVNLKKISAKQPIIKKDNKEIEEYIHKHSILKQKMGLKHDEIKRHHQRQHDDHVGDSQHTRRSSSSSSSQQRRH
jgi:hypothetical protein